MDKLTKADRTTRRADIGSAGSGE